MSDTSNDSADLEALFDSIATDYRAPAPAPAPVAAPVAPAVAATNSGDSDDLQALFDSVAAESQMLESEQPGEAQQTVDAWPTQEQVFDRLGRMTRNLHNTLSELGYDKFLEKTVSALPDAQDRLAYVANLTEQAACRVLNATDVAGPLIDEIESSAKSLGARWDLVFANQMSPEQFKQLAADTRLFLGHKLPEQTRATHVQLTEIMMAQDFQDLTGQVIKKVVSLAQELESGLMGVLLEVLPETRRTEQVNSLMNGPVIKAEGRTDVVVNQEQVDDLLDSLGF